MVVEMTTQIWLLRDQFRRTYFNYGRTRGNIIFNYGTWIARDLVVRFPRKMRGKNNIITRAFPS
jgi:hypothetical protein